MTPVQSTIKLKVKEKKKSILGFIPLWFAGFTKVSVNSDHQQIQIYYQHISIVNRVFLREWTYQNLMKLFSLSPYLLLCSPQRIILAHLVCLRNSPTGSCSVEVGHFESQQCSGKYYAIPLWVYGKLACIDYNTALHKYFVHLHIYMKERDRTANTCHCIAAY